MCNGRVTDMQRKCNEPTRDLLQHITPASRTEQTLSGGLDQNLPARMSGALQARIAERTGPADQELRPASEFGVRTLALWLVIVAFLAGAGSFTLARTTTISTKP